MLSTIQSVSEFIDGRQLLSDTKFYEGYSRFLPELNRYETWEESVSRVMNMHRDFFKSKGKYTNELEALIQEAQEAYNKKLFLGAQRALQFGGEQMLKHHAKMFNCFSRDTKFITTTGIMSFYDFNHNDLTTVLTKNGEWKEAIVKKYGKQKLNKITFIRNGKRKIVRATSDHRWVLSNGNVTTSLSVGDNIYKPYNIFKDFNYDDASLLEQLYWCYGYVFGDGTIHSGDYSMVRLCGKDIKFEKRFTDLGFKSTSSTSLEGDVIIFTGKYNKKLPDFRIDSPDMIRAFVSGLLQADGTKTSDGFYSRFQQTCDENSHRQLKDLFSIAGIFVYDEKDLSNQITNYGKRGRGKHENDKTILYNIVSQTTSKYNQGWKVESIQDDLVEDVWCVEVSGDDKTFILEGGLVTGNCIGTVVDRPEAFGEGFYWLLAGCGLGFSVQTKHIEKLPKVLPRTKQPKLHIIEDSIEGWAEALDVLMSSFFEKGGKHPEFSNRKVYFDWSKIRPKGALISGGFLAPGPEPLVLSLNKIENILIHAAEQKRQLRGIEIYDIFMHVADAVISGGVRRSATICFFSKEDHEMMNAKTGNWFEENPQRGRSNNTVVLKRNDTSFEEFENIIKSVKEFGEPGFYWTEDYDFISNPCVEIGFWPFFDNEDGTISSGSQGCNLCEINGSLIKTPEDLFKAAKCAAIVGTLQAAYTDFKFVSEVSKKIFDKEALLGVSITGWMDNPDVLFDKETLNKAVDIIRETNKKVSAMIGINQAARLTCTKPSGNASVLLKTASGIHGQHNKPYYIRHVQMNKKSKVAIALHKEMPGLFEESAWSVNKTDWSVAFPVVVEESALTRNDLLGVKLLEKVKFAQQHWVEYGTNEELCSRKGIKHNISNTISVDNWDEVTKYIYDNRQYLTGVSLLSMTGDKDYVQAPNTAVYMPEELFKMYGVACMFASGLIVDAIHAFGSVWSASDYVKFNTPISEDMPNKAIMTDWIRRFKKFALTYFDNDVTMAEYCLKDVHSLHRYMKIQSVIKSKNIDWSELLKEESLIDVDTMGAQACAGGACEI